MLAQFLIQSWTVHGLIVEFVGVLMIFVWGPPQPDFREYGALLLEGGPDKTVVRKKRRYEILSRLALSLIAIGLLLQLCDAWKG
jgi:hypothetical protein